MGSWLATSLTTATGIAYDYYPAVWQDSAKIYVKAQGEYDVNIYDIATDAWSAYNLPSSSNQYRQSFDAGTACRRELLWTFGSYLYVFNGSSYLSDSNQQQNPFQIFKYNITTGAFVAVYPNSTVFGSYTNGSENWGTNRHKQVVSDNISGRIFLINFYTKQIVEFIPSSGACTVVKTWTETIGGNSTLSSAGCSALCLNGKIYLLGKHGTAITSNASGMSAGPVEINIADWSSAVLDAYPDYGNLSAYSYNGLYGTQWFALGNAIYGYGGKLQGCNTAAGDGTGDANPVDHPRVVKFVPSAGTGNQWSNLGTISNTWMFGSTCNYHTVGYLVAGWSAASNGVSNAVLQFGYTPASATNLTYTYNPSTLTVTLNWEYSGNNPTFFKILRKSINGTTWTAVGQTSDGSIRTYDDAGIDITLDGYYYAVIAYELA